MTIKNKPEEFLDKDHGEIMDRYYELIDERELNEDTVKEMLKLIKEDPDFYDPYNVVAEYLQSLGKKKEARKLLFDAYKKAIKRITDSKGNYPESLPWAWLENRHIIRAIGSWARLLWEEGNDSEALDIFRELLRANPNDNTGSRFDILAIRMGLGPSFLKDNFTIPGQEGFLDSIKVDEWFDKDCKKFPEEFKAWFKALEDDEKIDDQSFNDWEYFDDCAICQEMKKAEKEGRSLSMSELKEAFRKAKGKHKLDY